MVRTRIAPSPTGIPHIGNTRTALFNYLYAKRNKGKFILRIEDTDRARFVPESEKAIYEILTWLGLSWDEEYKQSKRLEIYQKYSSDLLSKGLAYEDKGAIYFKMQKNGQTKWIEAIGNKEISFDNKLQENFVLIKSDGYPTYNFANVIDDHLNKISHVLRGYEFISSTPKHIQLYQAFGWPHPTFGHLPIILGTDRQKLSKRHGAKSVLDYREEGYLKEALLNFMVLLGWNPGRDQEIMTLDEMVDLFDLRKINKANPIFDLKKLNWLNGMYIRKTQNLKLKTQILEVNPELKGVDKQLLEKLISLAQTRMTTLKDFYELVRFIFEDLKITLDANEKIIANELEQQFSVIQEWTKENIFPILEKIVKNKNIKFRTIYKIISGKESGLPLADVLEIIGKEKTMLILKR